MNDLTLSQMTQKMREYHIHITQCPPDDKSQVWKATQVDVYKHMRNFRMEMRNSYSHNLLKATTEVCGYSDIG